MIPKTEIRDFGQFVAGLSEYNDFNGLCCEFAPFFVQPIDSAQSNSDIPVPDKYRQLIKGSITSNVTFVGKRRLVKDYSLFGTFYSGSVGESSLRTIAIDAGRVQGLRKNMLLRVVGDQFNLPGQYIKVTSVQRRTAVAVLIREVDDGGNETYPLFRPGMRVTTSPILNH